MSYTPFEIGSCITEQGINVLIRKAEVEDLRDIIKLLAADDLGQTRESLDNNVENYLHAFNNITSDNNNLLLVGEVDSKLIATMQLTFITYMTYKGGKRALIEAVRVDESLRGKGIGKALFMWAIKFAKDNHCHMVQLTTDKRRPRALSFYESLGFNASHEGLKLHLK